MEEILSQNSKIYKHIDTKGNQKIERGIYVFGLHRTGTHFLQKLINRNFNCWTLEHFEKHCYSIETQKNFQYDKQNTFLTMYKSPYKWIDSLVRNSHNFIHMADISFERNHTPLKITSDIPDDTFKNRKQNIVSLEKLCLHYNSYFYFWFEWKKQLEHHHFIKYEDLLFKTKEILKHICEKNYFELINDEFCFNKVTSSKMFTNSHREYYNKPNVFINLNSNHLKVINEVIDKEILERLNIDVID